MDTNWAEGPLMGFDVETTSIDPGDARIVEMALVLDNPIGNYVTYRWLVNPGIPIPLGATAVHGISTEEAETKGMPIAHAIGELIDTMNMAQSTFGPMPVCIYNAPYDLEILVRESAGRTGHDWIVIDPLACDRALDKYRSGRRTLTAVSAAYGVGIKGAHQSAGDAICTIKLARAMAFRYPRFAGQSPIALHYMQALAYSEWAEQFASYRQKHGEADFAVNSQWPYRGAILADGPDKIGPNRPITGQYEEGADRMLR